MTNDELRAQWARIDFINLIELARLRYDFAVTPNITMQEITAGASDAQNMLTVFASVPDLLDEIDALREKVSDLDRRLADARNFIARLGNDMDAEHRDVIRIAHEVLPDSLVQYGHQAAWAMNAEIAALRAENERLRASAEGWKSAYIAHQNSVADEVNARHRAITVEQFVRELLNSVEVKDAAGVRLLYPDEYSEVLRVFMAYRDGEISPDDEDREWNTDYLMLDKVLTLIERWKAKNGEA